MTISLILVLCAITIFIVYNGIAIAKFGIPKSLSDTFYYYQGTKKGLGYIFTAMMFSMAGLLMPAWITISDSMPGWEHNFTFLAFFAAAAIAFVGAAPAFKNMGIERKVHMIAAKSSAVFAMLWCAVVCWRIMYIIPISIGVIWLTAWLTKTYKSCSDYWWEMAAFLATFTTILIQCLILL